MDGPPVENGAVSLRGPLLEAVGKFSRLRREIGGPVLDLGEMVLLPGLINAHCHLDYTLLRKSISPPKSFAGWIKSINSLKLSFDGDDYLRAIGEGFAELKKWGTTSVLNIEAFPALLRRMPRPELRTWWFAELIDIKKPVRSIRIQLPKGWLGGTGLSPHAFYTASAPLFRRVKRSAQLVTTHLAESVEEDAMFRTARGPMFEFLGKAGRDMSDCGRESVIRSATRRRLLKPGTILVHVNELHDGDAELLRGAHIVHCPLSHRYFGHTRFAWKKLAALGANISLGTDSLASNEHLNLFAELREARSREPWLRSEELLKTVTVNPARALQQAGKLGQLRRGAFADLIALPFSGSARDACHAVIEHAKPVNWMMINGRLVD